MEEVWGSMEWRRARFPEVQCRCLGAGGKGRRRGRGGGARGGARPATAPRVAAAEGRERSRRWSARGRVSSPPREREQARSGAPTVRLSGAPLPAARQTAGRPPRAVSEKGRGRDRGTSSGPEGMA
eukprot:gene13275-biopygen7371